MGIKGGGSGGGDKNPLSKIGDGLQKVMGLAEKLNPMNMLKQMASGLKGGDDGAA